MTSDEPCLCATDFTCLAREHDTGWHRHDNGVIHSDDVGCTWLGNPVPCDPPNHD